jgi:UDPglucose 6-dehydrogenase
MTLMKRALDAGAKVKAFDPVALENLAKEMPQVVRSADMYACVQGADALVICTEWREFRSPDLDRVKASLKRPLIVDGRNLYRCETMQEHGFDYASVGRATVRGGAR